jgi:hypothetical protein
VPGGVPRAFSRCRAAGVNAHSPCRVARGMRICPGKRACCKTRSQADATTRYGPADERQEQRLWLAHLVGHFCNRPKSAGECAFHLLPYVGECAFARVGEQGCMRIRRARQRAVCAFALLAKQRHGEENKVWGSPPSRPCLLSESDDHAMGRRPAPR